jgi:alpha-1,2-mannosyltransferase
VKTPPQAPYQAWELMTRRLRPSQVSAEIAVFALALLARLGVVVASGGFGGDYGYDAGVYYAAGDALIHGRLPYRDFVLLHPPGLMLALAPFAWLGRVTTDHAGFVAASVAFSALGAVNAVLVVRVARRMGVASWPALFGGGFYALWYGAIRAEYLPRLEPLGNFLLLVALLALLAAAGSGRGWLAVAGGFCLGAAASVKIWWAAPVLLVLAWQFVGDRRWPRVVLPAAGAAGALALINGPFWLLSRGQLWQMVVVQQLGRTRDQNSAPSRLVQLTGLNYLALPRPAELAFLVIVAGVALAVCWLAWHTTGARLAVLLVLLQGAVLVAAPSWFSFYTDYAAPAAALTLGAGIGALSARRAASRHIWWDRYGWLPVAVAAVETVLLVITGRSNVVAPFPRASLARAVTSTPCLMSDSAMALIQLNALSPGLAHGCQNWVDVTGKTYGPDKARSPTIPRRANAKWQDDVRTYLLSGDAVILVRVDGTGLSRATLAAIRQGGVLAAADGYTIYRTPRE